MATKQQGTQASAVFAGKYRLDALLGTGGMGEVYRATRIADGAGFAVKILRAEHCSDRVLVERFLREARTADIVRHQNVVRVIEAGVDAARRPFFVQELLIGEDLALCLKSCGGRLSVEIAFDLLLPIVDAMGVAHASGVVHRDLKPGNVFLAHADGEMTPKLLDFGISSLAASTEISRITSTGTSLGTPAYMSPEQVMGQTDVDARSDVWSLGVMFYELVAGALPFAKGESTGALFVQICTRNPVPLETAAPEVAHDLSRVIGRCLRRRRNERYANAAELAEDLRRARDGEPIVMPELAEQDAMPDVEAASRAAARGAAHGSGDDVATVATPGAATASSGNVRVTNAGNSSMREIELEPPPAQTQANALKLATFVPPPMTTSKRRPVRAFARGDTDEEVGSALPFFAVATILAVAPTVLSPWPKGWSILGALESETSASPRAGLAIVAVVALVVGALAALRGVRRTPIAWGLLVAAMGAALFAVALGVDALMPGQLVDLAPRVVPWSAALVPMGLALHACGHARRLWSSGRKGIAVALVAIAAVTLAVAAQIARFALA